MYNLIFENNKMNLMTELSISIFDLDVREFPNNVLYELRERIAGTMEVCGFGAVMHLPDDKFVNQNITPDTDDVLHGNVLFTRYRFQLPATNGNLPMLLLVGIPDLINYVKERYNMQISTHLFYF